MDYLKRQMEEAVLKASKTFPVVMVVDKDKQEKTMLEHFSENDRKYVKSRDYREIKTRFYLTL